jgi:hypothetical protein
MAESILITPVNVAREHERRIGRDVWRYQVYPMAENAHEAQTFLKTNNFPSRVPLERIGHMVFLLNQAGFHVEFQPLPSRK